MRPQNAFQRTHICETSLLACPEQFTSSPGSTSLLSLPPLRLFLVLLHGCVAASQGRIRGVSQSGPPLISRRRGARYIRLMLGQLRGWGFARSKLISVPSCWLCIAQVSVYTRLSCHWPLPPLAVSGRPLHVIVNTLRFSFDEDLGHSHVYAFGDCYTLAKLQALTLE